MAKLPQSSEGEDASNSEEEWLPEQEGLANASSSDSGAEDTESEKDAVGAEDANDCEGVEAKNASPDRAQKRRAEKNVMKTKVNEFEGDLPPFLGSGK